jgi:hypothetical protein
MKRLRAVLSSRPNRGARPLTAWSALLASAPVLAHPGDHGTEWLSAMLHILTEPDHLAGVLMAVAVACLVWHRTRNRAATREAKRDRDHS